MFAGGSMTVGEVQSFLNTEGASCRPNAGLPCLKDYRGDVPTVGPDGYCPATFQGGNLSAAEIIVRAGDACNINPRVLIVLLQKEQSLVGTATPTEYKYARATGLDCPDNGSCSTSSSGLFKQIYGAAHRYQEYGVSGSYKYRQWGRTHQIQYHPNTACGTAPVYIQNRATAALYYYTPYQPNAAALNNLGGSGDACSATGNRNFWKLYSDWFGSTLEVPGARDFVTAAYVDVLGRAPEPAGLNSWTARISAGMARSDMATAFNSSDEYYLLKIREAYNRALNRDPEPSGQSYWLAKLQRRELSPENIYATFLYSDEMYNVQGGGTNPGYVNALYQELLGRPAEADGMNYWLDRLGRERRSIVSDGIWYSNEKYNVRVEEAFQTFLGRSADAGAVSYWSGYAKAYGPTAMRAAIMASNEYWARSISRYGV